MTDHWHDLTYKRGEELIESLARIAELEEALRPFAKLGEDFADTSDYEPVDMRCDDCRRARKVLDHE